MHKIWLSMAFSVALLGCGEKYAQERNMVKDGDPPRACEVSQADAPGGKRREILRCSSAKVLATEAARKHIPAEVRINVAKEKGEVIRADQIFKDSASANSRSDDAACQHAFINVMIKTKRFAQRRGGSAVGNFHSYLNKNVLTGGDFECLAGHSRVQVVMRGDVLR